MGDAEREGYQPAAVLEKKMPFPEQWKVPTALPSCDVLRGDLAPDIALLRTCFSERLGSLAP